MHDLGITTSDVAERGSVHCRDLGREQLDRVLTQLATNYNQTSLLNLSLVNCSLYDVNVLNTTLLRGLLSLDLSDNHLNDFKFNTSPGQPLFPLLLILRLNGNHLVVSAG